MGTSARKVVTWSPKATRSVITQVGSGCLTNVVREFAADVMEPSKKATRHDK